MTTEKSYRFNTFSGVFLPSLLTILGVVMFLRLGTIVGTFGIYGTLGILAFAESIAVATGLSISAISTNTPVESGGPYFLISRSLGPGFGSSVGLTYFVSQSLSVPFYILGFAEAMTIVFPDLAAYRVAFGLIPLVVLFGIALIGTDWAIRTQYLIFAVLALSVVAMAGSALSIPPSVRQFTWNLRPMFKPGKDFFSWTAAFAVFFPAVTGFLAGVNMSGDLENAGKSIPRGTLWAITVGFIVYLAEILLFGASFSRHELANNAYGTLIRHALSGTQVFIFAGMAAATLSSALGTLIGAPRILQAFAADKIFPSLQLFARGRKANNDPIAAMLLTLAISIGTLLWSAQGKGNALNAVAGLVTMFTLCTYAVINVAAAVEHFAANPSFRPKFRLFHWMIGVYGAAASFVAALCINAQLFLVAFVIVAALFVLARRRTLAATFGDSRRGYFFEHIRRALLHLAAIPADAKNWRPQMLILVGGEAKHRMLIRYASWLGDDRGILSVGRILDGSDDIADTLRKRQTALRELKRFSDETGIVFFPVVVATDRPGVYDQALHVLVQAHSLGPLTPNIILAGWPSHEEKIERLFHHLRTIGKLKMNLLLLANADGSVSGKSIDIWWRGRKNGPLMLILAHLLQNHRLWKKLPLRLLRFAPEAERADAEAQLHSLLETSRIDAEAVVVSAEGDFTSVYRATSADAAVVFLGFPAPEESEFHDFFRRFNALTEKMPATFLVSSAEDTALDS
ncbi:MAG: amino acid permease [Victivallaceae bacterium]|nr:amino acid permease [Victivallaceae bacterium]